MSERIGDETFEAIRNAVWEYPEAVEAIYAEAKRARASEEKLREALKNAERMLRLLAYERPHDGSQHDEDMQAVLLHCDQMRAALNGDGK